jgi:hypothetical protein
MGAAVSAEIDGLRRFVVAFWAGDEKAVRPSVNCVHGPGDGAKNHNAHMKQDENASVKAREKDREESAKHHDGQRLGQKAYAYQKWNYFKYFIGKGLPLSKILFRSYPDCPDFRQVTIPCLRDRIFKLHETRARKVTPLGDWQFNVFVHSDVPLWKTVVALWLPARSAVRLSAWLAAGTVYLRTALSLADALANILTGLTVHATILVRSDEIARY